MSRSLRQMKNNSTVWWYATTHAGCWAS